MKGFSDKKLLRITSLAFIVPSSMLVGYGIGYLLGLLLKISWLSMAGLFLGIIAGFYDLIKEILKYNRELNGKGN